MVHENELFIDKVNKTTKNYPEGENRLATRLGKTGQGKADRARLDRTRQDTFDDEPTQDCKHKEIIKGANEVGNEQGWTGTKNRPWHLFGPGSPPPPYNIQSGP